MLRGRKRLKGLNGRYPGEEELQVEFDDRRYDSAVGSCDPNGKVGSKNEEDCEEEDVQHRRALPRWDHYLQQFEDSIEEHRVHIPFPL